MGTYRKVVITIVLFVLLFRVSVETVNAKPNTQCLYPTGYALTVVCDRVPFHLGNGKVYALPEKIDIDILAQAGENVYCQLPDGSRGFVPTMCLEGSTADLSQCPFNKLQGKSRNEKFNIVAIGTLQKGKDGYYRYVEDNYKFKHPKVKQILSVPANYVGVKFVTPMYAYLGEVPHESIKNDVIVVVRNPNGITNFVGRDITEVESYLGRAKAFVGDALTDIGYAYSFYRNVAYEKDDELEYGLCVCYDKNSVCVDVIWTPIDMSELLRHSRPSKQKLTIPKKPIDGARRVNCAALMAKPVRKMPLYDKGVAAVSYEHNGSVTWKNFTYGRFADIIAGENILSSIFIIVLFYGLFIVAYYFMLKQTSFGSNIVHKLIILAVGVILYATSVYGMLKFSWMSIGFGGFFGVVIIGSLYSWLQTKIDTNRCPHCLCFYAVESNFKRVDSRTEQKKCVRSKSDSTVVEDDFEKVGDGSYVHKKKTLKEDTYTSVLKTSVYGKYEFTSLCPKCATQWQNEMEVLEHHKEETVGKEKVVTEIEETTHFEIR